MTTLQEFHKPNKNYKQVKAERIRLPDRDGAEVMHNVMVYMSTSGTPHFAIGVPPDYANAWKNHQHRPIAQWHEHLFVTDGAITGESFLAVLKKLEVIAKNFQHHIRNVTLQKVIRFVIEIKGATGHKGHNEPSFSNTRVLVGIRSGVFWEVNGGYYAWNGQHRDAHLPYKDPGEPVYADLSPQDMRGNPITIPFTKEAWATVQEVEGMLQRAADMLLTLVEPKTAEAILLRGMSALAALAAPDATTATS